MNLITSLLLLAAGCCLVQFALVTVTGAPLDLIENLKISDDLPETPVVVENELFERNIYAKVVNQENDAAANVREENVVPEGRTAGMFI